MKNSPGNVWGTPSDGGAYSPEVQQHGNSCVWNAQYEVMKDYGFTGTADDVVMDAFIRDWYDPVNGTSPEHMSSALEAFGVKCDVYENGNIYDLLAAVKDGKKVIVSVDSGELWADNKISKVAEWFEDVFGGNRGADHALVVSGFDNSDPKHPTVVLTDTGTGQAAVSYPVKQFANAWADGRCRMVIPCEPPPHVEQLSDASLPDFSVMSVQEWVDSLPPADMSQYESLTPSFTSSDFGWQDLHPSHHVSFMGNEAEVGEWEDSFVSRDDNEMSCSPSEENKYLALDDALTTDGLAIGGEIDAAIHDADDMDLMGNF